MEPRLGIYIAGPMRNIPAWNFPAFHRVHDAWVVEDPNALDKIYWFCPACQDEQGGFRTEDLSGGEDLRDLGFDLRRALGKDLSWIAKNADVVVVLPGWENSKGAQAEVALAYALDLIVMAYDEYADGFGPASGGFVPQYLHEAVAAFKSQIPVEDLWADGNDYGYQPAASATITLPPAFAEHFGLQGREYGTDVLQDGEVRLTSSTGAQKGTKPARFELIPAGPLWLLAELYGKGAVKYEDRNWERGYPWSLSYGAAGRHMTAFWKGEDYDNHKESCPADCDQHTELPHPICAVFHMFALTQYMEHNNDFDDRPIR